MCSHDIKYENEDGHIVCEDCGQIFYGVLVTEDYSQVYGDRVDAKPRNFGTKPKEANPYDEYNIPPDLKDPAYEIYKKVVKTKCRCRRRKGLLAACLYCVYRDHGKMAPPGEIARIFGIKENIISKAMILVSEVLPPTIKSSKQYSLDFINRLLENLDYVSKPHHSQIEDIINKVYSNNTRLRGIRPQNITAAAICYCMEKSNIIIKRKRFAEQLGTTEALLTAPLKLISNLNTEIDY